MTSAPHPALPVAPATGKASAAKARLLGWADEHDARSASGQPSIGRMIGGGVAAALLGALVARGVRGPRRSGGRAERGSRIGRLLSWAFLVRAGARFLPHILAAVNRTAAKQSPR